MAIDEITKKRFDNLGKKIDAVDAKVDRLGNRLDAKIDSTAMAIRTEMQHGFARAAQGIEIAVAAAATGIKQHIDEVLAKVGRMEELEARVAKLEALLTAGTKQ